MNSKQYCRYMWSQSHIPDGDVNALLVVRVTQRKV